MFSYPNSGGHKVMQDFNVTALKGQTLALVGEKNKIKLLTKLFKSQVKTSFYFSFL
jgi:ABC-type multidrug transport system fused ATPase/permease subunit